MTAPVKVFVSYSWSHERQTGIVDELEKACNTRGINLIRDSNTMQPSERISRFMERIADASHVIVVLSEAYFQSKYCLYEWKKLLQQKGLEQKIYPIKGEDLDYGDQATRRRFITFWKEKVANEEEAIQSIQPGVAPGQHDDLNLYREFEIKIDKLMEQAGDMLAATPEALSKNQYADILDLILPQYRIPPDTIFKPHQSDQDFMSAITSRIKTALDASDTLRKALACKIDVKGSNENSGNLTQILLDRCKNCLYELLRDHVHIAVADTMERLSTRPGNDSPLVKQKQKVQQLTNSADELFSCLVLWSISDGWMHNYQEQRIHSPSNLTHLPFSAAAAIEILTSRHLQRLPRFKLNSAKSEVLGQEGITALEDGFEKDDIVTGILRQIWVQVFPMDVKENLNEKRLRAQIKTRHKRRDLRKNNYYLIIPDEPDHPLMDIEVQNELIKRLPELPLIIIKMDDNTEALVIPGDGELASIILDFYLMLDEYIPYEQDKNRSRPEKD